MEVPAAFREFAEKSVTQAKDNWEKMKAATEEASDLIEDSYATASKGAADYGLKVIEVSAPTPTRRSISRPSCSP